jgi:hypothetical protein
MQPIRILVIIALGNVLVACSGGEAQTTSVGSSTPPAALSPATTPDPASPSAQDVDNDGGDGAGSLPDPCSLVTQAEMETAVGGKVIQIVEQPGGPISYAFGQGRLCTFVPAKATVSASTLSVFPYSAAGWETFKKSESSYSTFREVKGVGEEAVSSVPARVTVHQTGYVVDLGIGTFVAHDKAGPARVLALAKAAIGRLGS